MDTHPQKTNKSTEKLDSIMKEFGGINLRFGDMVFQGTWFWGVSIFNTSMV